MKSQFYVFLFPFVLWRQGKKKEEKKRLDGKGRVTFPHWLHDFEIASPFICFGLLSVVLELHFLSCQ